MASEKTTADSLVDVADILNRYGPQSWQFRRFLIEHDDDRELIELAHVSAKLKRALTDGDV